MKLHDLTDTSSASKEEDTSGYVIEFNPLGGGAEEDEEEDSQMEADLNEALILIEELLPHYNRYVNGRMVGERRGKVKQGELDALLADASIFIDQWTMPIDNAKESQR